MKKRTSKEILAETLIDLSKTKPIEKITVKQIVNESGLSLQTFYNHFSDKAELLSFIHKTEISRIFDNIYEQGLPFHSIFLEDTFFEGYYREFMRNVTDCGEGLDLFIRQAAQNVYDCLIDYISRRYEIEEIPFDTQIYTRSFAWTISLMYEAWVNNPKFIEQQALGDYIMGCVPESLKQYLD